MTVTVPGRGVGDSGTCRSCGASIVWVLNAATGKKPPYNADGVSHFATCPHAPAWKGRSGASGAPSGRLERIHVQSGDSRGRAACGNVGGLTVDLQTWHEAIPDADKCRGCAVAERRP